MPGTSTTIFTSVWPNDLTTDTDWAIITPQGPQRWAEVSAKKKENKPKSDLPEGAIFLRKGSEIVLLDMKKDDMFYPRFYVRGWIGDTRWRLYEGTVLMPNGDLLNPKIFGPINRDFQEDVYGCLTVKAIIPIDDEGMDID